MLYRITTPTPQRKFISAISNRSAGRNFGRIIVENQQSAGMYRASEIAWSISVSCLSGCMAMSRKARISKSMIAATSERIGVLTGRFFTGIPSLS